MIREILLFQLELIPLKKKVYFFKVQRLTYIDLFHNYLNYPHISSFFALSPDYFYTRKAAKFLLTALK